MRTTGREVASEHCSTEENHHDGPRNPRMGETDAQSRVTRTSPPSTITYVLIHDNTHYEL